MAAWLRGCCYLSAGNSKQALRDARFAMAYAVAAPAQHSTPDAASNTTQRQTKPGRGTATGAAKDCSNASTTALTVAGQAAGHRGCTWLPALLLAGQAYAALGDAAQAVVHLGQASVKQPQRTRFPAVANCGFLPVAGKEGIQVLSITCRSSTLPVAC